MASDKAPTFIPSWLRDPERRKRCDQIIEEGRLQAAEAKKDPFFVCPENLSRLRSGKPYCSVGRRLAKPTAAQVEKYRKALERNGGFHVPRMPGVTCAILAPMHLTAESREMLKPCCQMAIEQVNKDLQKDLEFVKMTKANRMGAGWDEIFYITFKAHSPSSNSISTLQVKVVRKGFGKVAKVYYWRIKETGLSSDLMEGEKHRCPRLLTGRVEAVSEGSAKGLSC